MAEVLKVLFCCFGPALLYQLWKTIRERMEQSERGGLRGSMLLYVAERAANARPCGIWIEEEDADWAGGGYWRCSACGFGYSYGMLDIKELSYCPHCGARMEGATLTDR